MVFFISSLILSSCSNDDVFVPVGDSGIDVRVTTVAADEVSFSVSDNDYAAVAYLVLGSGDEIGFKDAEALFSVAAAVEEAGPFYFIEGLSPETEYTLYVAVRYYNGTYSGISVSDFRTSSPSRLFDVGIGYVNYAAIGIHHIIPKDTVNYKYFCFTLQSKDDFENIYGGVEGIGESFYFNSPYSLFPWPVNDDFIINFNEDADAFYDLDVQGWYGNSDYYYNDTTYIISPDTDYVIAAWYTDEEGHPVSEVECTEIHTMPLPEKSPLEFMLHYEKGDDGDYIRGSSNHRIDSEGRCSHLYFEPVFYQLFFIESRYLSDCKSDTEIADKTVQIFRDARGAQHELGRIGTGMYDGFTFDLTDYYSDDSEDCFWPEYKPDTEYVMCAFATYCGKILSDPAVVRFKTPADPVF